MLKKKMFNNWIFICKSMKLASSAKKLNLQAVKCHSWPLGVMEVERCGEGQALGHVLYKKFNCSGKEVEVTHWAEIVSISQYRFQIGEESGAKQ